MIGAFNGIPVPTKNPLAALFGATGTNNNIDAVFGKIFNKDNLSAIGKNAKAVFTTAAAKADPAAVAKAQIPFIQSQLKDLRLDTARQRQNSAFWSNILTKDKADQLKFGKLFGPADETIKAEQDRINKSVKAATLNAGKSKLLKEQIRELRKQARGSITGVSGSVRFMCTI